MYRLIRPVVTAADVVGYRVVGAVFYLLDLLLFLRDVMRGWRGTLFNRASYRAIVTQMIFTGVDALLVITILGLAVGVSVTAQLIFLVQMVGTEKEVVMVLTEVVLLELGTLLTAIVVIGRSGSAIAVDLGGMKLRREVEGLELLGIDINDFFITPRLVGVTLSLVVLAIYFSLVAIVGGVAFSALLGAHGPFYYLRELAFNLEIADVGMFMLKTTLFGVIIGATACLHGLRVEVSATELPQQTQRALVNGLLLIFILDGLLALVRQ